MEKSKSDSFLYINKQRKYINKDYIETFEKIASGSYGTILKGKIKFNTKKDCAIKEFDLSKDNIKLFEKEATIIAECNHKYIIKTYGYYIRETKVFQNISKTGNLVMELCTGGDLSNFIHNVKRKVKGIPKKTKIKYLRQIAEAMYYLHENNITHRDLKPSNCLISKEGEDGVIKICDFGTSKHISSVNATMCGTSSYIAPEVISSKEEKYNPILSDIYSFGILAWELCSEKIPYSKEKHNSFAFLLKITQNKIKLNIKKMKDSPKKLKDLVKKCINRNPKDRPKSFLEILKILKKIK